MTTGRINQVASSRETATLQHADAKSASTGPGHRRSKAKVGRSDSLIIQPSPSDCRDSHGSMNTAAPGRFESTPGAETKPRGKGMPAPNKAAGGPGKVEGKTAPTRRRLIRPEAPLAKMSNESTTRTPPGSATPDAPPAWRSSKGAIGPHVQVKIGRGGTERSRRERGKIKNSKLGKRVAGPLGLSPARHRRAEGHRPTEARGKWPLHCASHAEGQAIAQSRWGNKPT
ncbi:hypothetical protein H6P81_021471 [Aristolochia fimbriata]|uniref:Uncharacterized protein n=1 Tax=Aristolochia fimbriata TaxID=158543 RepID=A0AAV7DQU0_ARIFI|nr:hypothetical protein H6P81_021471 [Aristolochia fimbriata]